MKKNYTYRVKPGTATTMREILESYLPSPWQGIEGKACRVTIVDLSTQKCLKKEYREQYRNENLFQIEIAGEDVEYLVMSSMLESNPE